MKKISLIAAAFMLAATQASAGVSVGIDYLLGDGMEYEQESDYGSGTYKSDVDGLKLKVGFGSPDSSVFQLYYAMLETEHDAEISEFGLNGRGYVAIADEFKFFYQGGLGYGSINEAIGDEDLSYLQAHLGVGLSYILAEQVELSLGYDYKFQVYEDIEIGYDSQTISTTATGGGLYFGASYYFSGIGSTTQTSPSSPTIINNINNTSSGSIEQERVY